MTASGDTLRALAKAQNRHVGVALATWHFGDSRYLQVAGSQFDSLTAENEMKWESVQPQPGQFNFGPGDQLVAFAEQHGMRVRGHTLVWHNQLSGWARGLSGDSLRGAMIGHVKATVGHWKGRIAQWDVVNEAVGNNGELRQDSPFTPLGPGYIADAFFAAHEADPSAELVYNDYETEGDTGEKSEGTYRLVKQLKERGVPIHGVGFQMHVDPRHWPSADSIRRNLERFAALGVFVELTEMDIPIGELSGSLEQKFAQQSQIAHDIVKACLSVPACKGITFWGLTDPQSWLATPRWGQLRGNGPHLPLLFDGDYRAKPVFEGVSQAFRGL
ncbi:MAG TPA: endo-1,4-beta-xylanase [Polyangiaceae bacterium]|nr:endo-1,4-beta-xylanase [Polyangiaceae bacterium]